MIRGLPVFGSCQSSQSVALAKRVAVLGTRVHTTPLHIYILSIL